MASAIETVSPTRQLAIFSVWCSSQFGFCTTNRKRVVRGDIAWRVFVTKDRLVVHRKSRKRSFEAQIHPEYHWTDRLKIVFRLWKDVTLVDFTPISKPIIATPTKQRWISLLDLALVLSILCDEENVQLHYPATVVLPHKTCRLLISLAPPRAQLVCETCGIFLGGPRMTQKSHRFSPVEHLLHFCTSALHFHHNHFVSEYSALPS